ncbi:MAG: hypothetical protein EXS05_17685 [Planctomycetaceae bacterium]|nr:hypothetical protein [Planctomycetaceae bacterium]
MRRSLPENRFYDSGMNGTHATTENATAVLGALSVDALQKRLYELRGEEAAVKTLLRSLKARDRARRCPGDTEATHAS